MTNSQQNSEIARDLMLKAKFANLGTLSHAQGFPLSTLVNVAFMEKGAPLLLLSTLSAHTHNILKDSRASLLFYQGGKGDPLAHPRITLYGNLEKLEKTPQLQEIYLKKNPKAKLYFDFGDFLLFFMLVEGVHFNGGFGRAAPLTWQDLSFTR